ncbi:MAG: hypothetical protein RL885_23620 [Planctomycetota bacterium]
MVFPRRWTATWFAFGLLLAGGCDPTRADDGPGDEPAEAARRVSDDPVVYEVTIGSEGDALLYDVRRFTVEAESLVRLTLVNSSSPAKGMLHNWLLVMPGTEDAVAAQGLVAGYYRSWVPESEDVLASGRALKAGERELIEFRAPSQAGSYPYLCTIPGHAQTMRGVMLVE